MRLLSSALFVFPLFLAIPILAGLGSQSDAVATQAESLVSQARESGLRALQTNDDGGLDSARKILRDVLRSDVYCMRCTEPLVAFYFYRAHLGFERKYNDCLENDCFLQSVWSPWRNGACHAGGRDRQIRSRLWRAAHAGYLKVKLYGHLEPKRVRDWINSLRSMLPKDLQPPCNQPEKPLPAAVGAVVSFPISSKDLNHMAGAGDRDRTGDVQLGKSCAI